MEQEQQSVLETDSTSADVGALTADVVSKADEPDQPKRDLTERHKKFMLTYPVPAGYDFVFNNPGYAIAPQIKNPEDHRRIDTSGETWRVGMETAIKWDEIVLYRPLKELVKGYVHNLLNTSSYANAAGAYARFKRVQWLFAEAGEYPVSESSWLAILAELREWVKEFGQVKDLYRFGVECGAPGFNKLTLAKIDRMHPVAASGYLGVKLRQHVLTDAEKRAIRKALAATGLKPLPRLPNKHRPNALYPLDSLIKLFGLPKPFIGNPKRFHIHITLDSARNAGLKEVKTPPPSVPHGKGLAAYEFKGSDIAQALQERRREVLLRNWFKLQTNVMTHINYALGARPDQINGANEGGFEVERSGKNAEGAVFYRIALPRRKKGTAVPEYRSRPIPEKLGKKIEQLLQMKHELFGDNGALSPLFVMTAGERMRRSHQIIREYLAGC